MEQRYKTKTDSTAFNAGCDAALHGKPMKDNPYDVSWQYNEHSSWRRGWEHVRQYFGCDRVSFVAPKRVCC